jgi:fructokinase
MRILCAGELVWDIFPDAEHLGGAPLNFAVHAHRLGHDVMLASAVGDDELGRRMLARIEQLGLSTRFIRRIPDQPTGTVTVRFDAQGEPDFLIHRPAAYDFLEVPGVAADWFYFGTMVAREAPRTAARRFYDVNLRKNCFTPALVDELMRAAHVVKMNQHELAFTGRSLDELRAGYGWHACCVTYGAQGCTILIGDDLAQVPGIAVQTADPVGAGDAFAAAFLHGLDQGWSAAKTGAFANRLGALVASRPGAIPDWTLDEL